MTLRRTALIVILASLLEPLLKANESQEQPAHATFDSYDDTGFQDNGDSGGDDTTNFITTLKLPHSVAMSKQKGMDIKRQFGSWGGKKRAKPSVNLEFLQRKRQFSPWGGKRSSISQSLQRNDLLVEDEIPFYLQQKDLILMSGKRNFNSWGGKKTDKVLRNVRSLSSLGGKRNFDAWGGKRAVTFQGGKEKPNSLFSERDTRKLFIKPRTFSSWGGKRDFNSWGDKRTSNLWSRKRRL